MLSERAIPHQVINVASLSEAHRPRMVPVVFAAETSRDSMTYMGGCDDLSAHLARTKKAGASAQQVTIAQKCIGSACGVPTGLQLPVRPRQR